MLVDGCFRAVTPDEDVDNESENRPAWLSARIIASAGDQPLAQRIDPQTGKSGEVGIEGDDLGTMLNTDRS